MRRLTAVLLACFGLSLSVTPVAAEEIPLASELIPIGSKILFTELRTWDDYGVEHLWVLHVWVAPGDSLKARLTDYPGNDEYGLNEILEWGEGCPVNGTCGPAATEVLDDPAAILVIEPDFSSATFTGTFDQAGYVRAKLGLGGWRDAWSINNWQTRFSHGWYLVAPGGKLARDGWIGVDAEIGGKPAIGDYVRTYGYNATGYFFEEQVTWLG